MEKNKQELIEHIIRSRPNFPKKELENLSLESIIMIYVKLQIEKDQTPRSNEKNEPDHTSN